MRTTLTIILLTLMLAAPIAHAQQPGRDRVLKIDAVELIDQQREVEGQVEFQQQHGRYTYLFASNATLKAFQANPAKYEIQQGGACGRMGPLSGEGSPKLFTVHDGRLYIFASEQCRRAFIAAPAKFLDVDDPKPEVDAEAQRRGRVAMDHIAAHSGMLRAGNPLLTVRERLARSEESGGVTYAVTDTLTLQLPDGVRNDVCWNESCWGNIAKGDAGWSADSKGASGLVESQRIALLREAGRHPWYLASQRDQPGFQASDRGERRTLNIEGEGEVDCALVEVHWLGVTTTLAVDGAGRVRMVAYRGRGPDATFGHFEKIYSAFHDVDGFELPGRVQVTFEGKPEPTLSGRFAAQAINDPADKAGFIKPELKD